MANWIVTSGTLSTTGSTNINNQTVDLVIKPELANGEWSGAFIKKENFKIGGSTETSSGSCVWQANSGSWNVDPDSDPDSVIDEVQFFNSPDGVATNDSALNTQGNKVICRVSFANIAAPNVDTAYNIDIDENTDTPIVYTLVRKVCYRLKLPYNPQVAYTFLQDPGTFSTNQMISIGQQDANGLDSTSVGVFGLTRTLLNEATYAEDGHYMWQISGEIDLDDAQGKINTCKFAVRRANNHVPIDPLNPGSYQAPFDNPPDFSTHTFSFEHGGSEAGNQYQVYQQDIQPQAFPQNSLPYGLYPHQAINFYREGSGQTAVDCFMAVIKMRFNPMEGDEAYATGANYPDPANYCDLGHQFNLIEVDVIEPEDPPGLIISDVIAPVRLTRSANYQVATVRGTPGAEYTLCLQKAANTDTTAAASTKGYFNFNFRNFESGKNSHYNSFTIPAEGFQEHLFKLAQVSSDTRYDIFVEPRNTTTISSNAPSQPGDLTINQTGARTLTLYPSANTPSDFVDLTAAALKVTLTREENRYVPPATHVTVLSRCQTTISSSTSLILQRRDIRIKRGMIVTIPNNGNGVPHNTTVSNVEGRVVTLSAASSITAKDTVRFDTNSSRILAFSKTFTGSSNTPEFTTTATTAAGFKPEHTIGNLYGDFEVIANATGSGKSIALRSGSGNTNQIGDVSLSSKFLQGPSISSTLGDYVEITGIDKANDTIAVSEDVNFTAGDLFRVVEDPRSSAITTGNGEIQVIHVQGNHVNASPDTCTISGYLYINSIPADISLPINIDTLITTGP